MHWLKQCTRGRPALRCSFAPDGTVNGELPPGEVAKAYAFHVVLEKAAETLGQSAHELVGGAVASYIASKLTLMSHKIIS